MTTTTPPNRRFLHGVELIQGPDGLWRDKYQTVYALADDSRTLDPKVRCGVAPFALPESDEWTDACRSHDYAYSSPAYQEFHDREDADGKLELDLDLISTNKLRRFLAPIAAGIARIFGGLFWENPRTR